jgi:uncharacterized protein
MMRRSLFGLGASLMAATPSPSIPPPSVQLTADCRNSVYASDQFVCSDAELRMLDSQLADTIARFDSEVSTAPDVIWEDHFAWLRRRSLCAFQVEHRKCLIDAYSSRQTLLEGGMIPPLSTEAMRCARWPETVDVNFEPGNVIAVRRGDKLLVLVGPENTTWPDDVGYRLEGSTLQIRSLGGQLVCQPVN